LAFSPDGTILATASDDNVTFWALDFENDVGINPVHRIILDGQQVSSVLFIDGGDLSSCKFKFRYVILGTERNTILHLYDVESAEYIQSINFLPPPERRPSLSKAYRKEEAMFNCVSFDQKTSTLLIANSARFSIFALHLYLPYKKAEQFDLCNQATFDATNQSQIEYESIESVDDLTGSNVVQFDYMIEFPVNQVIGSFVVVPDTNSSQGFSLYCIQTKAVQQYHIAKYFLLPPNLDACPEYDSAETSLDLPQQEEVEDTKKDEQNKVSATETSESSLHFEEAQLYTAEDNNIEKDIVKETVVETTEEYGSENTALVTGSEDTLLNEKRTAQESTTGNIIESTVNSDENENKGQESQKVLSNIKLSGAIVNGTIAKLKEKKKAAALLSSVQNNNLLSDSERTSRRKELRRGMERDKDSGNENINHSSETTSKAAGKKSADGTTKNNGKIGSGVGEKTKKSAELQEGTK
jgi:hypothetical protein